MKTLDFLLRLKCPFASNNLQTHFQHDPTGSEAPAAAGMNMLGFASITITNNQFHFHSLQGVFVFFIFVVFVVFLFVFLLFKKKKKIRLQWWTNQRQKSHFMSISPVAGLLYFQKTNKQKNKNISFRFLPMCLFPLAESHVCF